MTATDINQPVGIRLDTPVLRSTLTCMPPELYSPWYVMLSFMLLSGAISSTAPLYHWDWTALFGDAVSLLLNKICSIEWPHYVPLKRGLFSNVTFFSCTDYVWCLFIDEFSRLFFFVYYCFGPLLILNLIYISCGEESALSFSKFCRVMLISLSFFFFKDKRELFRLTPVLSKMYMFFSNAHFKTLGGRNHF